MVDIAAADIEQPGDLVRIGEDDGIGLRFHDFGVEAREFLLSVFAEILVTTNGGPGYESTNLAYLVYALALLQFDVGGASAGGIIAVILANIVAFFLIRMIGRNLEA